MDVELRDDGGKRPVKQETNGDFKVIVAIDFGAHGTSMGYAVIGTEEKEPTIHIEQDWCANPDSKNKTDILLNPEGTFLAFGEEALAKFIVSKPIDNHCARRYMDAVYDDSESESEEWSDSDDRDEEERRRLALKPMLFEAFKMALYEAKESSSGADGDIRAQILCSGC